jgi:hypothetical protein
MFRFLGWTGAALFSSFLDRFFPRRQWALAWAPISGTALSAKDFSDLNYIFPPNDRFYADPFLMALGRRNFILFEDYPFAERKGVISCVEIYENGLVSEPRVVLDRPYHLSYPFIFQWADEYFMIPETAGNGRIEAYRCKGSPFDWEFAGVLVDQIEAVDPTIFEHDGRLWLSTNVAESPGITNDEMFLFSSNDLFGPWIPHSGNPVVSDVRRARPAGSLFRSRGRLIRPSQDCSEEYGWRIKLNCITQLQDDAFEETEVGGLEWGPNRNSLCTHTINFNSKLLVFDFQAPRAFIRRRRDLLDVARLVYSEVEKSTDDSYGRISASN